MFIFECSKNCLIPIERVLLSTHGIIALKIHNSVKMLKTHYYKNILGTYFVQTCRQISIYNGMYQGSSYDCVPSHLLSYFSTETYVVGTEKNRHNEMVLLRPKKNMCVSGYMKF